MSNLRTSADLKSDVLFRASENTSGVSGWDTKVMDYLNRVYRELANGASEFLPEYIDDWWWLRARGILTLEPIINTGTVSVTKGSASITFSNAPASSVAGYRIKTDDHQDIFLISTHTGGATAATLDSVYTGETSAVATYKLMRMEYDLANNVVSIISPMSAFRGTKKIYGYTPERMDALWPIYKMQPGAPEAFSLEDTQTVRFSHGGLDDGTSMRVEYLYRPTVSDLADDATEPLVPLQFRHALADMALTFVLTDKNDDRAAVAASAAKATLLAMVRENRRRLAKINQELGTIRPRLGSKQREPVRTESGLIIG